MNKFKKRRRYRLRVVTPKEITTKYPYKVVDRFNRGNSDVLTLDNNISLVFRRK